MGRPRPAATAPAPKISRGLWAKENICNNREQQTVHDQLRQRVKRAEDDVECDPSEEQPARPVVATEHKHSAKNSEQPYGGGPENLIWKRMQGLELGDMVCKSNDAGCYEYASDDGD